MAAVLAPPPMAQTAGRGAKLGAPQSPERLAPIAEERGGMPDIAEIAEAVVERLDVDRKIDERVRDLWQRGDRIARDVQARQEHSTEALLKLVELCLENQRSLQAESQRVAAAVVELGARVVPLAPCVVPARPCGSQAVEAHARAAPAMMEEMERLKLEMDEHRLALAAACAESATLVSTAAQVSAPPAPAPEASVFSITLRKADDVNLGLSVTADEENRTLVVQDVSAGGAVETWNRQCVDDERVVAAGDRIVRVNGIEQDAARMLEACATQRLVKLSVSRGPGGALARAGTLARNAALQAAERQACDTIATAQQLQQTQLMQQLRQNTQHLAPPPGLFRGIEDHAVAK